jgi:hypothetical protein
LRATPTKLSQKSPAFPPHVKRKGAPADSLKTALFAKAKAKGRPLQPMLGLALGAAAKAYEPGTRPRPAAAGAGGQGLRREEPAPAPVPVGVTGHRTQNPAAQGPSAKLDPPEHTQPAHPKLDPGGERRGKISAPSPLYRAAGCPCPRPPSWSWSAARACHSTI